MSFCLIYPGTGASEIRAFVNRFCDHPLVSQLVVVYRGAIPDVSHPKLTLLPEAFRTPPAILNRIYGETRAEFAAVVPSWVELYPETLHAWEKLLADERVALVYSGYLQGDPPTLVSPVVLPQDLSEKAHPGFVRAVRVRAVREIGGLRPEAGRAADYDLRLRLVEKYRLARWDEPGYEARVPDDFSEGLQWIHFFQDAFGPSGPAAFVRDKDREADIERTFYQCLKRRGLFLRLPDPKAPPSDAGEVPVSIVVRGTRGTRHLGETLQSIQASEFRDFEVVLVGAAAAAVAADEVGRWNFSMVRVAVAESSPARALNEGVRQARGRYVMGLDAGDRILPHTLGEIVRYLEEHPRCAHLRTHFGWMRDDGTPLPLPAQGARQWNRNNLLRMSGLETPGCWRRNVFLEMEGIDAAHFPDFGGEYDLVLRMSEHYDVGLVPHVLMWRRKPAHSATLAPEIVQTRRADARKRAIFRRAARNRRAREA